MSASTLSAEAPYSRSRSSRGHSGGSPAQSGFRQQSRNETSPQTLRQQSRAPDDVNTSTHTPLANPVERAARAQHDERPSTSRAASIDSQQTRKNIKSLDRKLERLEPHADGGSTARMRWAEDNHQRKAQSGQHDSTFARDGGDSSREMSPAKQPRAHSSSPTRAAKAVWCGNNKLDKRLRVNGGHMEVGSPHACFQRGVGAGIHQDIPPGEEHAFLEKWRQPYAKLVKQPIWYKDTTPPPGMFKCTLPQAMQRGFAVGSKLRADKIVKRRGHTTHEA